jgi:NhaP-type Na+/H+ or K+/H+ antiporter
MNDGTAFPFVMLGLGLLGFHDLGEAGLRWALLDVIWASGAGVAVGLLAGVTLGRLIWSIQRAGNGHTLMHDFIGLGFVGVVYGLSELIHAWGFLAVFFAAVSLRQTELKLREILPPDGEALKSQGWSKVIDDKPPGLVSEGSLVFKEHLERLSEVVLVILVGGSLFLDSWSWRAASLAIFLFFAARPLSVLAARLFSRSPGHITAMTAWFGIRGIGSLYYLMYAIQHGLPEEQGLELIHFTLIVVALSIVVHGFSATPLMKSRRRREMFPSKD